MTVFWVRYNPTNGEILGYENSAEPMLFGGDAVAPFQIEAGAHFAPDPKAHCIDLDTLELVDKTLDQQKRSDAPALHEIKHARFFELTNTDAFMAPDRPMDEERRAAWRTYRQALRDISKFATPADMINAWPIRPDGVDPINLMRSRV